MPTVADTKNPPRLTLDTKDAGLLQKALMAFALNASTSRVDEDRAHAIMLAITCAYEVAPTVP